MNNPDNTKIGSNSLALATPIAILFLFVTILLFMFRDSIGQFKLVLWLALPIFAYIVCSCVNLISQYIACSKIDAGKAFLGGLPALGTVLISTGLASVSYCRIPVASVFSPLLLGKTVDVSKNSNIKATSLKNSKECCTPKITLEAIETQFPVVAGIAHGFYVMFGILFGFTIGNGISAIC